MMANTYWKRYCVGILLIGIMGLFACKRPVKAPGLPTTEVNTDLNYTVIDFDTTLHWVFDKPMTAAELSEEELKTTEQLLAAAVDEWNKSLDSTTSGFTIAALNGYKRQFVPVVNARGEKEVWVNCFCSKPNSEQWREEIVVVDDGGSCYFNVKINLTTQSSYDLAVNGEA